MTTKERTRERNVAFDDRIKAENDFEPKKAGYSCNQSFLLILNLEFLYYSHSSYTSSILNPRFWFCINSPSPDWFAEETSSLRLTEL